MISCTTEKIIQNSVYSNVVQNLCDSHGKTVHGAKCWQADSLADCVTSPALTAIRLSVYLCMKRGCLLCLPGALGDGSKVWEGAQGYPAWVAAVLEGLSFLREVDKPGRTSGWALGSGSFWPGCLQVDPREMCSCHGELLPSEVVLDAFPWSGGSRGFRGGERAGPREIRGRGWGGDQICQSSSPEAFVSEAGMRASSCRQEEGPGLVRQNQEQERPETMLGNSV